MILLCGQKVGCLALEYFKPDHAVCYDEMTSLKAQELGIKFEDSFEKVRDYYDYDVLSVHGRERINRDALEKYNCLNIHPYLYKYKGSDPIGRALSDRNSLASVGLHYMTEEVDCGPVIFETFRKIRFYDATPNNRVSIYEQIYPLYERCFKVAEQILKENYETICER